MEIPVTDVTDSSRARLIVPAMGSLYAALGEAAETLLRLVAGAAGAFWSPLLSFTELFAGLLIAAGFLTRPASFAAMFILCVTVWFHWVTLGQGYAGAEKSILWAAIFFFFVIRGGNRHSVDGRLGRQF